MAAASAPQPVPATSNTGSGVSTTPAAAHVISPPATADSPRQPKADLTAHLPTNLLGLDQEPDAQEATPTEKDVVSASNPEPEAAAAEVNPSADESAAEPIAHRRGRPRKARPEAQPESAGDSIDQEQAPATAGDPAE